ncbi:hypothetical protein BSL78_06427 [Apostichopus japonicus]|uniref:C2H2-type domain-containing protein n=1 Tax=Stichopus japonicus TaxID=307972 RepID=A0A2G8L8R1_STIJA|nr:hypothetical protein BSL78_06427 [Apostichopus japonicus]
MSGGKPLFHVEYKCGDCARRFGDLHKLSDHAESEHERKMFECKCCYEFWSPRKVDTLKHEQRCEGKRSGDKRKNSGGCKPTKHQPRDTERKSNDGRKGKSYSPNERGKMPKKGGKVLEREQLEDTSRVTVEPSYKTDKAQVQDLLTAIINPSSPRLLRPSRWPTLHQLVDLGSPFRSVSAEREIEKANREEKAKGRQTHRHSSSYPLVPGLSQMTTLRRVVYPDGRVYEVEEKQIVCNKDS